MREKTVCVEWDDAVYDSGYYDKENPKRFKESEKPPTVEQLRYWKSRQELYREEPNVVGKCLYCKDSILNFQEIRVVGWEKYHAGCYRIIEKGRGFEDNASVTGYYREEIGG